MSNTEYVQFNNNKAVRVGRGISTLRRRCGLSLEELAAKAETTASYLKLLEEGHEPIVDNGVIISLSKCLVSMRGAPSAENALRLFLSVSTSEPEVIAQPRML